MAHELNQKTIESRALYAAAIAFASSFLLSLVVFWDNTPSLFGRASIGSIAAWLSVIASFGVFLAAFKRPMVAASSSLIRKLRNGLTTFALGFVYAAVAFMLIAGAFFVLQDAFKGATLDHWTASLIAAAAVAAVGYGVYLAASSLTSLRLSTLLAVFLVAGALTSMMTATDPQWWELHFSSLGGGDSVSSKVFNVTLVVAGLVIVALSDFIAADFAHIKQSGKQYAGIRDGVVRTVLALIGVFLACVGIFAYDTNTLMHNGSAWGMALLFIGLIASLRWIAPGFSRSFYLFSYSLMAGLAGCYWLFNSVGYLNLTVFEMMAAGTIFIWMIVFVRQLGAALEDLRPQAQN